MFPSEVTRRWQEAIVEKICSKIYESSKSLIEVFKSYDKDGDGCLDYGEFINAMKKLDLGLTNDQLYDLMRSIDKVKTTTAKTN